MKDFEPKESFILPSNDFCMLFIGVITVGVLLSLALPNLLGGGRPHCNARMSEARSVLMAMLRAQQTVFAETGSFATTFEELEVSVGRERFYTLHMVEGEAGLIIAKGIHNEKNDTRYGTKDFIAGINFNPKDRTFNTNVCVATTESNNYTIVNPTEAISNYGIFEEKEEEPIVEEASPKVTITQSFQNTLKNLTDKMGILSKKDEVKADEVRCEQGVEEID